MFGPKIRNVFKSRWHALAWSASILLTTYGSIPPPDDDGEQSGIAKVMGAVTPHQQTHKNPWAKETRGN